MNNDKKYSVYDNLNDLERELSLPKDSLKSIPIYARVPAAEAIKKVLAMERNSLFRPGLYYIVLADLVGNTQFNVEYGNKEADIRVQWFHTAAIQTLGKIDLSNYVTFSKTIGDAALLIFSSIEDVISWSETFTDVLQTYDQEYETKLRDDSSSDNLDEDVIQAQVAAFSIKARRLVHLGEIRYADKNDPLSLAVSQTFKIEKEFSEIKLGCTEIVASTVKPVLAGLGYTLEKNKLIKIVGEQSESQSYYIVKK